MLKLQREKSGLELSNFFPRFTYNIIYVYTHIYTNTHIHIYVQHSPLWPRSVQGLVHASAVTGLWGAADHGKPDTYVLSRLGVQRHCQLPQLMQQRKQC